MILNETESLEPEVKRCTQKVNRLISFPGVQMLYRRWNVWFCSQQSNVAFMWNVWSHSEKSNVALKRLTFFWGIQRCALHVLVVIRGISKVWKSISLKQNQNHTKNDEVRATCKEWQLLYSMMIFVCSTRVPIFECGFFIWIFEFQALWSIMMCAARRCLQHSDRKSACSPNLPAQKRRLQHNIVYIETSSDTKYCLHWNIVWNKIFSASVKCLNRNVVFIWISSASQHCLHRNIV